LMLVFILGGGSDKCFVLITSKLGPVLLVFVARFFRGWVFFVAGLLVGACHSQVVTTQF
jgi:hypothetical protein